MKNFDKIELQKELNKRLNEECNNIQFMMNLNQSFGEKGLSLKIPALLLDTDDLTSFDDLSTIEQITLLDSIYNFYDKKLKVFNPENYFSDSELSRWDTFIPTQELADGSINQIKFKNVIKISDSHYVSYMTLEEIYLIKKNMLVRYNKQSQRKPSKKTIGTKGFTVEEISLDESAKEAIKAEFKQGKFTPNLITFNMLVQDGKIPQKIEEGNDVVVIPNYDRNSPNTTYVDCIDGYHRFIAAYEAYKEELEKGKKLEGGLIVSLVEMTLEDARNYVVREFKRSATDSKWLKAITENDYTKTADDIIRKINLKPIGIDNFKEVVGIEYEDVQLFDKLTYRDIFVSALELTNLNVSVTGLRIVETNKVAEIINIILSHIAYAYFNKDYKNLIKKSYLLDYNMFIGYIAIADTIKNEEDYQEKSVLIAEKLYKLNSNHKAIRKELSLGYKNFSIPKIYNYFKALVD